MVAADRKLNGPVANRIRTVAAHDGQQFVGLASGQQRQVAVEQIARERIWLSMSPSAMNACAAWARAFPAAGRPAFCAA
jgi:hypothetical protein